MNEEKLIAYIKGEITSADEIVGILDWIESEPHNRKFYNDLKNTWVLSGIDHPETEFVPTFNFPENKKIVHKENVFISLMKYAAVFMLAFGLGASAYFYYNKIEKSKLAKLYNVIEVPNGERSRVILYDGTKVWLNSGTKFKYPVSFSATTRDVSVEGEAFFDVAKDPKHTFVVRAGQLKTEVLGTHFNVCAYPEENKFAITLEEGTVKVFDMTNGKNVTMKPNEQLTLNRRTNDFQYFVVNTELYTSWKENMLKFEDAPFEDVIKKMERWYDVKITVDASIDSRERYTMTIKTESLREMLKLVAKTTKMKYEIFENQVTIKKP